jgi:hypothetical protein
VVPPLERPRIAEKIVSEEHGRLCAVEDCAGVGAREAASCAAKRVGEEGRFVYRDSRIVRKVYTPEIHDIE